MKKIVFLGIFLVFFLSFNVSAAIQLNIYVDSTGDSLFLGETDEIELVLPEGISLKDGRITGFTPNLTMKSGDTWIFEYYLDGSEMNVILPEGARISELTNGEIFLEKNQIAVFMQEGAKISYVLDKNPDSENSIILIILAILIVGAIFYIINYLKSSKENDKEEKKESKIDNVKGILNERERLIIEKLKESGKIKGSYLRKQCDIPKASFSRHVQELEKKGLIKRTGEGKNKFIELNE
ncbi:hypothetical protein COU60_00205 [Candidatus Pacearchaeota archaeon CG10_big_fil_rev_8_21_14_0_10_34_76]|nr:MAG: hypothetical protein COU60_00205 [Candidatus Pacearchaeota archaeon CG10_big_fil_rev_8_21_14_0_10_34_76]